MSLKNSWNNSNNIEFERIDEDSAEEQEEERLEEYSQYAKQSAEVLMGDIIGRIKVLEEKEKNWAAFETKRSANIEAVNKKIILDIGM